MRFQPFELYIYIYVIYKPYLIVENLLELHRMIKMIKIEKVMGRFRVGASVVYIHIILTIIIIVHKNG